jgi:hypothetical protein
LVSQFKNAGKSDFRTPVESNGLQKPEMPALRKSPLAVIAAQRAIIE